VLQSIPFMAIDDTNTNNVYNFLRTNLTDQNKFVRVWSYNGFHELSRQHPEYLEETQQYFEMAMRDEAPSVKARIRNIMKKD
jgi:3-methyladenine DNA glycosylase AlkC